MKCCALLIVALALGATVASELHALLPVPLLLQRTCCCAAGLARVRSKNIRHAPVTPHHFSDAICQQHAW
jgi:hypothetical protein